MRAATYAARIFCPARFTPFQNALNTDPSFGSRGYRIFVTQPTTTAPVQMFLAFL